MVKTLILAADKGGEIGQNLVHQQYSKDYNIQLFNLNEGEDEFDFYERFGQKVVSDSSNLGILISGDGIVSSIVMNKIKGIRACLCHTNYLSGMTREHNNSNVLVIGADISTPQKLIQFIPDFMSRELQFEAGTKVQHARRVDKIMVIEKQGIQTVFE